MRIPVIHLLRALRTSSLVLLLPGIASAEFTFDANVPLYPEVEQAIVRAQTWLASRQRENGSWDNNNGKNGMAAIALMVNGNTPGKGPFGAEVAKGIDYIISTQDPQGLLAVGNQGPMYQHALATLALAEAYGLTHNPDIREVLIKAIDLLVETQDYGGGWRYEPHMMKGDLSVTVMQVMALRSCTELGIYVPEETINHAIKFIRYCWTEKRQGFGYTGPGEVNYNRTAAGVVCLQSVGLYDDPIIPKAIETIDKLSFDPDRDRKHYWYGHYYASVALYHHGGDVWKRYYPKICTKVLDDWAESGHYREVLDTSWAILVIGVPYRYLPIYQR